MKPSDLYTEIKTYCQANADESNVKKYSRFFKEGYDAYGLSQELLEAKVNQILSYDKVDLQMVIDTSELLLKSHKYEETSFAILLLHAFSHEFNAQIFDLLDYWFKVGITNWAHTDVICVKTLPFLFVNNIVDYKALAPWRIAVNKYQRRAVPVAMISMLKTHDDYPELFEFLEVLMLDGQRTVQQALGWFLREAWKNNSEVTEDFLLRWKDTAPRLIFQYATEKMSSEQKERFKKERKKR